MKKFLAILLSATMLFGGAGLSTSEALNTVESATPYNNNYYQYTLPYDDFYYQREVFTGETDRIRTYNQVRDTKYGSLILVNEDSLLSDGLSASGLVGATNGLLEPIMKSESYKSIINGFNLYFDSGKKELPRNVYIIGGPKAINPSLDNEFRENGFNVKRIQGKNRIETSYNIAREIKALKNGNITEMAVTKGYNGEADAVSIASEAIIRKMPIILTNGSNLPKESPLGAEVKKIYAIGGPAVIKDSLVKQLKAERIGGKNRYETNAKVIKRFGKHNGVIVVSGDNHDLGTSLYASTVGGSRQLLLINKDTDYNKAEKYVDLLNGSKSIFVFNWEIDYHGEAEAFVMGTYGKTVLNAYRKARNIDYRAIGLKKGPYLVYKPESGYFEGTFVNPKDYTIFTPRDGRGIDHGGLDYNIAVSKDNKKVYIMPKGYSEPIDVTDLVRQ